MRAGGHGCDRDAAAVGHHRALGALLAAVDRGSAGGFAAAGGFDDAPVDGDVLQVQAHDPVVGLQSDLDELVEDDPVTDAGVVAPQRVGINVFGDQRAASAAAAANWSHRGSMIEDGRAGTSTSETGRRRRHLFLYRCLCLPYVTDTPSAVNGLLAEPLSLLAALVRRRSRLQNGGTGATTSSSTSVLHAPRPSWRC